MALSTAAWFCSFLITFNIRNCKEGEFALPDPKTLKCKLPQIDHLNVIEYVDPNNVIKNSNQIFVANISSDYFLGMTVFFNCTQGYTPNKISLTCKKRFNVSETVGWNGDLPKCVPNKCKWSDPYKNVVFTYKDQLLPTFSMPLSFPEGTMVRYLDDNCAPRYRVKHASMPTRHCDMSGKWAGSKPQRESGGDSCDEHYTDGSKSSYVNDENNSDISAERTSWRVLAIVMTCVSLILLLAIALYFITRRISSNHNNHTVPRMQFVASPPVASGTLDRIVSDAQFSDNCYEAIDEVDYPYQTIPELTNRPSNNLNDYDKPEYAFPVPKVERVKAEGRINPFDVSDEVAFK